MSRERPQRAFRSIVEKAIPDVILEARSANIALGAKRVVVVVVGVCCCWCCCCGAVVVGVTKNWEQHVRHTPCTSSR